MSTYGVARFDPYGVEPRTPNLTAATAFRQVDQLSGDVVRLTRERDDAIASRDAARADVRDVTNALQSVNCQCEELTEERDNWHAKCESARVEIRELTARLENVRTDRGGWVEHARTADSKSDEWQRQNAELVEENASLRCRIQELTAERNDLQAQAARP